MKGSRLLFAAAAALLIPSCGLIGRAARKVKLSAEQREAMRKAELLKPVGVVDSVTSREYVLVKLTKKGLADSKPELEVWRNSQKVGKIKLSGEEKDGWAAADILEGEPMRGDTVRPTGAPSPTNPGEGITPPGEEISNDPNEMPELMPPPGGEYEPDPLAPPLDGPPGMEPAPLPENEPPPPLPGWAKPEWQNDTNRR